MPLGAARLHLDNFSTGGRQMKKIDGVAAALVLIGGLNWGLVAVAKFDLVAAVFGLEFGETNAATRVVYGLVGLSAVYGIGALVAARRAGGIHPGPASASRWCGHTGRPRRGRARRERRLTGRGPVPRRGAARRPTRTG